MQDPNQATYMLQANVRSVGEADESAIEKASIAGFGGVAGGAAIGAVLAGSGNRGTGAVVGGAAAAAAELVSGAHWSRWLPIWWSPICRYPKRTAGGVSEQFSSDLKARHRQDHRSSRPRPAPQTGNATRLSIVSTARQTNLTFP